MLQTARFARLAAFCLSTLLPLHAQIVDSSSTFASGATVNATQPDPVMFATDGTIWISFINGADSTGQSGSSTVVQYDTQGNVMNLYTIAGSVDGLKQNPFTRDIWVLQNQDGNSTLTLIKLTSGLTAASPLPYAVQSGTQGYDDVVFLNGSIFMSYTNPVSPTDPTLQTVIRGTNPIQLNTILTRGATGTNVATGQTNQPLPMNDPDSLKQLPNGAGIQLTSGDDGALIFVENPGASTQSVSFLNVLDSNGQPTSGLDDALFINATAGTFFISDTGNNQVLKIHVSGITPGQLFASSGSLNALVTVSATTGIATPLVTLNSPHGFTFFPDQTASPVK